MCFLASDFIIYDVVVEAFMTSPNVDQYRSIFIMLDGFALAFWL